METTLGAQHIQAMRIFRVDMKNLNLTSLNGNEIWIPGEIKRSVCNHAKAHGFIRPEETCTCGIWSCKSRKDLHQTFPFLYGQIFFSAQIEQWGKVIEHKFGYRSEYARIIPDSIQVYPRRDKPQQVKLVKFLRNKYLGN